MALHGSQMRFDLQVFVDVGGTSGRLIRHGWQGLQYEYDRDPETIQAESKDGTITFTQGYTIVEMNIGQVMSVC